MMFTHPRLKAIGLTGLLSLTLIGSLPLLRAGAQNKETTKNLLTNPGAEKGAGSVPDGWDQAVFPAQMSLDGVVDYIWHGSIAHTGKRSLCFKKSDNRFFPVAQWRQEIKNTGSGKKLAFGAWIKTREAGKATLTIQFNGADGTPLGREFAAYVGGKTGADRVTQEWKSYQGTVAIPEGTTTIVVVPEMYGPGVAWFDDMDVHYVP